MARGGSKGAVSIEGRSMEGGSVCRGGRWTGQLLSQLGSFRGEGVETKPDSISWIRVGRRCEAILELVSDKIGYFVSTRENRLGFSSNCENVFLSYVYLFFRVEILMKCSSISSEIIMIFKL